MSDEQRRAEQQALVAVGVGFVGPGRQAQAASGATSSGCGRSLASQAQAERRPQATRLTVSTVSAAWTTLPERFSVGVPLTPLTARSRRSQSAVRTAAELAHGEGLGLWRDGVQAMSRER